jgi:hypothetical protein
LSEYPGKRMPRRGNWFLERGLRCLTPLKGVVDSRCCCGAACACTQENHCGCRGTAPRRANDGEDTRDIPGDKEKVVPEPGVD